MFYETKAEADVVPFGDMAARQNPKQYQTTLTNKIDEQKGDKNFLFSFTIKKGENQTTLIKKVKSKKKNNNNLLSEISNMLSNNNPCKEKKDLKEGKKSETNDILLINNIAI